MAASEQTATRLGRCGEGGQGINHCGAVDRCSNDIGLGTGTGRME